MILPPTRFGGAVSTFHSLPDKFDRLYDKVVAYLSDCPVYVRDAYACADNDYRTNIRAINEYPWSNQFVYNMFLRPQCKRIGEFRARVARESMLLASWRIPNSTERVRPILLSSTSQGKSPWLVERDTPEKSKKESSRP